jgi:lycopene cyclase domain-containing protein
MYTYLIVNLAFLAVVIGLLVLRRRFVFTRPMIYTLLVLLVFTAVFDSLIVMLGICAYDPALILGVRVGAAPIEDFFYALLAGLVVPIIWNWKKERP